MEINNNTTNTPPKSVINDPYFEEVKTKTTLSIDFVLWLYRFLKYWYLFAICILVCYGYARLKNKSWVPYYQIQALMMLESRGTTSIVEGAVPLGTILRNTVNQQIVLRSRGMVQLAVDNLPKSMFVDYFRQNRFRSLSIYGDKPVEVVIEDLKDIKSEAFIHVFNISYIDEEHCRIFYDGDEFKQAFSIIVPYDKVIEDPRFKIKLQKTESYTPNFLPFSFRFLNKENLLGNYSGKVSIKLLDPESTALQISMVGPDPAKDIQFLDVFLNQFQNYNLLLKNEQAKLTIDFIDKQSIIINDSLERSRITLEQFQKQTGIYEVTSPSLRAAIQEADKEKDALTMKERALLMVNQKITEGILGNSDLIDPNLFGLNESALSSYITGFNETLKRAQYLGVKNPLYEKTIDELNDYREKILKELQYLNGKLQEDKDALAKKYQKLEENVNELPPQERVLVKYERDYRVNEMYQNFLSQRKYEAQIQQASNTPDNFIFEYPQLSGGAINSNQLGSTYIYYLLIGMIIPVVFVILKEEVFNYTISTKEECERITGLPVIGTIENISKKLKNGIVLVKNYPKSSFAESFRNLRVRIEYMAQKENKIVVLITSAEPADGKTFVATNIASVYQLMGKKVVILDLDLRRPSVAKLLQIDNQNLKGISNYLIGQVTLEEVIISHPDFGFDVIPAGTLPPNPSELIKTAKTQELIEYLRSIYDYVIIDCSPVGLVSDAYILAKMVNTSLFVIRRGKTNKSFLKSVISQIKFDGIEHVALIFNDVKGREGYYGTSRYYGDKTYYLKKKSSYYHDDYFEN